MPFRNSSKAPPHPSWRIVSKTSRSGRWCKSQKVVRCTCGPPRRAARRASLRFYLADAVVLSARCDLEDREVGSASHVARALLLALVPAQELDGEAEQRVLLAQLDVRDLVADLGPGRRPVLAGLHDRLGVHGSGGVTRQAEGLLLAAVRPLVRLERGAVEVHREGRDERASSGEGSGRKSAVRAEHDRALTRRAKLGVEELGLPRELPRDVDDLDVRRDTGDQGREVRNGLVDGVAGHVRAGRAKVRLDLIGQTLAVRLLVVDDVDAVLLHLLRDPKRHAVTLLTVVGN